MVVAKAKATARRVDGFANDSADDVGLARIRERLAALYGDRARLELRATAGRSRAVLEIAYETAQDASGVK